MAFTYTEFGSTALPNLEGRQDIGSGAARIQVLDLPGGGAYDATGGANDRGERGSQKVAVAGIVADSDLASVYYPLRALVGTREKLWRTRDDGTTREWAWARMENIRSSRQQKNMFYLELEIVFVVISPAWYSETESSVIYYDAGVSDEDLATLGAESSDTLTGLALAYAGNFPQRSAEIRATVLSGTVTALSITNNATPSHTLAWAGSMTPGDVLVIDCGALLVTKNGSDAYSGLTAPTNVDGWLVLYPNQSNSLSVTITGGSINLEISFYDAWV